MSKTIVNVREFESTTVPASVLAPEAAKLIWTNYNKQVAIDTLLFGDEACWQLTSLGWVGQIPVTPGLELRLQPKTSLSNLFGMLEYAYNIKGLQFFPGLTAAESLQEFYSQLAKLLAKRVLARSRKGFYHTYRTDDDMLPYVRGRIALAQAVARPWSVQLACQYQDHTANIDDNRILTWTLWRILRTGYCEESALNFVRQAYRTVQGMTELQPYAADSCVGRTYQRLNEDYRPLHALSPFSGWPRRRRTVRSGQHRPVAQALVGNTRSLGPTPA
jgi:5-methylcytosine-specific restriction enzyme subunit McrC